MTTKFDILLKGGVVVDPVSQIEGVMDVGIRQGKIAQIEPDLNPTDADECFYLDGYHVVPGIIDLHTHESAWLGGRFGHKMMAQAGVTTALDMSGPTDSVLDIARENGAGLNIAVLEHIRPGHTVGSNNPQAGELRAFLAQCLQKGALGWKLLGGHYPLTPDATATAIRIANENRAYVAFHAGTTNKGSNIEGMMEAIELADGNCLHLAHVNSYCRGLVRPHMLETEEAIAALKQHPRIRSESYLATVNGTSAKCTAGVPESDVTKKCLVTGGYPATEDGLEQAIVEGWAQINLESGGKMVLAVGKDAAEYWRHMQTDTTLSFQVNPPEPRIRLATAKRDSGQFVVDCISTDGGGIPRNVIVDMGLALVKLQALSMRDFVQKTSVNPARILGLTNKGHFQPGADADISVLHLNSQQAYLSLVGGKVIMYRGYVCGSGSQVITAQAGAAYVRERGLTPIVVDLANSAFYQGIS
ncbi:MAG: amidohydrolase family protein [Bacillota bacterium]|jgi:hypothetical protein